MKQSKNFPEFELVKTRLGVNSIRNIRVNEIMHNPVGPMVEADLLYVKQSNLAHRLISGSDNLVLYDVGLGAAGNALAAINLAETLSSQETKTRKLHVISFEEDLNLLKFALANKEHFELVEKHSQKLETLLEHSRFENEYCQWDLRHGNFLSLIDQEKIFPELIFHDPYSPKLNPEMWSYTCFKKLFHLCDKSEKSTHLLTYSRATPVRVALLISGFFVGAGASSGLKDETTEASTTRETLISPLGERWFDRWQRSDNPLPPKSATESNENLSKEKIEAILRGHPQFSFTNLLQKHEKATIK